MSWRADLANHQRWVVSPLYACACQRSRQAPSGMAYCVMSHSQCPNCFVCWSQISQNSSTSGSSSSFASSYTWSERSRACWASSNCSLKYTRLCAGQGGRQFVCSSPASAKLSSNSCSSLLWAGVYGFPVDKDACWCFAFPHSPLKGLDAWEDTGYPWVWCSHLP